MKNLFTVHNIHTKERDHMCHSNKAAAKVVRDKANGGLSTEDDKKWNKDAGWRVTYGPDHWRYQS